MYAKRAALSDTYIRGTNMELSNQQERDLRTMFKMKKYQDRAFGSIGWCPSLVEYGRLFISGTPNKKRLWWHYGKGNKYEKIGEYVVNAAGFADFMADIENNLHRAQPTQY